MTATAHRSQSREVHEVHVSNGIVKGGDNVLARNHDAYMVSGTVEKIVPWGCPWLDPNWCDASVIIKDHDDRLSAWNPELVEKIDL